MTDTISDEAIETSNHFAGDLYNELMATIDEITTQERDTDLDCIAFSLWIDLGRFLISRGWTAGQLAKETVDHAEVQKHINDVEEAGGLQ